MGRKASDMYWCPVKKRYIIAGDDTESDDEPVRPPAKVVKPVVDQNATQL